MNRTQARTTSSVNNSKYRTFEKSHYALDWARLIRFTAPTIGLTAILGGLVALTLGAGCASKGLEAPTGNAPAAGTASDAPRSAALDVRPVSTGSTSSPQASLSPAPTPTYVPPSQPPAYAPPDPSQATDPVVTQAPTLAASTDTSLSAGGTTYTVQHGDTLFRIAKEHYGSGKQWTRIASANPGLTPAKLRAGQKIILP